MKLTEFFNNDYVDQASYDNLRKIASLVDGQKNAARKIIYTIQEKNIKSEVKVNQLGSKVSEFCLTGDTLINTIDFGLISIKDLAEKDIETFRVMCVDDQANPKIGIGKNARLTKYVDELIEIRTDAEVIRCTPEHRFLVRRNDQTEWVQAQYLTETDDIVHI